MVDDGAGTANRRYAVAAADWESMGGTRTPASGVTRRSRPRTPRWVQIRNGNESEHETEKILGESAEDGSEYQLLASRGNQRRKREDPKENRRRTATEEEEQRRTQGRR